jgi:hypothetical protein
MRKLLFTLLFLLMSPAAYGQGCGPTNPNCVVNTQPPGTSNNTAASTAFVQQAIGGIGGSPVTSVSNADSSLTIAPISGAVIASLNVAHANTWTATQTVNAGSPSIVSTKTTSWFSNNVPPVNLDLFGDRVFIGDAVSNTANSTPSLADWYSAFNNSIGQSPPFIWNAVVGVETTSHANSGTAILGAAQTLHFTGVGNAIGSTFVAVNNNTTKSTIAFGTYAECHVQSGAFFAACFANEADPRTEIGIAQPDPFVPGQVVGYQSACGAGVASTGHPCAVAYQVVANPETYNVGINIENGSVTIGGAGGNTAAVAMPTGYQLVWYSAASTIVGTLGVDGSGNVVINGSGCLKFNGTCVTVP